MADRRDLEQTFGVLLPSSVNGNTGLPRAHTGRQERGSPG